MAFDFDAPTNRFNTDSVRWDRADNTSVLPLWVADMDFSSPPCVIKALNDRVQQGIYGYTHTPDRFHHEIAQYLLEHYQWKVNPDWIVVLPSVVSGLYTAVEQLTNAQESVLIPTPVYHHLKLACTSINRRFQEMPLQLIKQRWVMPTQDLSSMIQDHSKLALLCNPQNPGSTVFTESELKMFGNFCVENNLWICSDEIHAGLVLDQDKKHIPIASLSQEISQRTITLMSLNKTFNFPGVGLAWAVAENPLLRKAMQTGLHQTIAPPSLFAFTASVAAIHEGEPWRQALIDYLRVNRDLISARINAIPNLSVGHMEASYLAWIDCSGLESGDPYALFLEAGLATSPGSQFGQKQFVRLNFGTQRSRLIEALNIIESVADKR